MPKEDPFVNRAQLLKAIKKYPEIWDSNNKLHMCRSVTAPMWNEIAEQFGGHVPTVKLQSIWSQMKYHYHNLVHRQILHKERFTTKWEHFEPMSFMYNITVAKIVGTGSNNDPKLISQQLSSATQLVLGAPSLTSPLPQTQSRGRPSGSFTWLPPTVNTHTEISIESTPYIGFTGLIPPAVVTVEATTTPLRKPGRPVSLNNSMRGRIIDAIKRRPTLWAGRQREQRQGQNRTSAVWKEVAIELNLTPSLLQTRWSIIKQRYVDELQKERHAQYVEQLFQSSWEHFDGMSFMRDILEKKVDEREQTREHIQEIVSEQQHFQTLHQIRSNPTRSSGTDLIGSASLATSGMSIPSTSTTAICNSNSSSLTGSIGSMVQVPLSVDSIGRRRVKTENDLEWDPFEMILHVNSTESAAN